MKRRSSSKPAKTTEDEGDFSLTVSTGSTLLDLAISGGRCHGGGIPSGILVEIFGPEGSGKTVMLCEIAGAVQRAGGKVMFKDPEARLNKQFASMFDMNVEEIDYSNPDKIPEVFAPIREWNPEPEGVIHGIFADSLAALSTDLEMDAKEGDKMGMRRAKEFSQELRKTCRILAQKKFLLVCSNQVRQNLDAGPYENPYITPGGKAIPFYASLRLRCSTPKQLKTKKSIGSKEVENTYGVETNITVVKSSVWKPYRTAPVNIIFDYGIDDIRGNLRYLKQFTSSPVYILGGGKLDKSLEASIRMVEEDGREEELREEVITQWNEVENKFHVERKPKRRG
jgi:recombination protein RecA